MTDDGYTRYEVSNFRLHVIPIGRRIDIVLRNPSQFNDEVRKFPLRVYQNTERIYQLIAFELYRAYFNDVVSTGVYSGRFQIERYKNVFVNAGQIFRFSESLLLRVRCVNSNTSTLTESRQMNIV